MTSISRSVISTCVKISAISILSLNIGLANAAVSSELSELDSQWATALSTKNLDTVTSYYDEKSIVASFPYLPEKNLVGAKAIGNMFKNGPFNLKELNVEASPVGFDENESTALLLKNWKISHSGGAFSGLAIEVLSKSADGWKRTIDMAAGGFAKPSDFAKQPVIEQSFKMLDTQKSQVSQLEVEQQSTELNDKIKSAIATGAYENINSLVNEQNGLLIARVKIADKEYITFNALTKLADKWQVKVQFFSAI